MGRLEGYGENTVRQAPTHAMSVSVPLNKCAFVDPREDHQERDRALGISGLEHQGNFGNSKCAFATLTK